MNTLKLMDHATMMTIIRQCAARSAELLQQRTDEDTRARVFASYRNALRASVLADSDSASRSTARVHLEDAQITELDHLEDAPAVHAIQALELFQRDRGFRSECRTPSPGRLPNHDGYARA